jgi:hypothetical protein
MVGRFLWPSRRRHAHIFVVRALLRDDGVTKEAMLASPAVLAFEDDPEWELIDAGGDWSKYKNSDDPSQCECGDWWTAKVADAVFAAMPNQNDITALMKTVPEPTDVKRPKCDDDCISVKNRESESWCIFKNKNTGQFGLTCTKTANFHCERVRP